MSRMLFALALFAALVGCGEWHPPARDLDSAPPRPATTVAQKQCVEGVYYYGLWHDGTVFVPHTAAYGTDSKVQTCTSDK